MTIDEAIAHAREVAKRNRGQWKNCTADRRDIDHQTCEKCAKEHEQIAEWLEELKEASHCMEENRKAGYNHGFVYGYNKAIDDFSSELENHSIYADIGKGDEVKMEWVSPVTRIEEIAQHLKAGDWND